MSDLPGKEKVPWTARYPRRETLARLIYETWVARMAEEGHGDKVYIWDAYWLREPFIEAVSIHVGWMLEQYQDRIQEMFGVRHLVRDFEVPT